MDAHLADDRALAQRLFVERGADAGGQQRVVAQFADYGPGIELGADHCHLRVLDAEFAEHFLRDVEHPVEVAVAAGHAAAAEDHRRARLQTGLDHVAEVGLDRLALEVFLPGAEVVGAGVHRACVGDDRVHPPLDRALQRLARKSVPQCAAGGNDAIDHVWIDHVCHVCKLLEAEAADAALPSTWNALCPAQGAAKNTVSISGHSRPIWVG